MKIRHIAGAAAALLAGCGVTAAGWFAGSTLRASTPPRLVSAERLTNIPLRDPIGSAAPQGLAIVVSDTAGWTSREDAFTDRLRDRGLAVLEVNLDTWRTQLDAAGGVCLYLGSDLENLAKEALRVMGGGLYFHPVVAGLGEGGTLAYAAIADAPFATFAGAVALDPAPVLDTRLPTCPGAKTAPAQGGGFSYTLDATLPAPAVLVAPNTPVGLAPSTPGRITAQAVIQTDPQAREAAAVEAVARFAEQDAATADLPVVDIPAVGSPNAVALFYSGDGGWRDLDKTIGDALAQKGVHVLGVDSLRYFWSERRPEEIARDAETILEGADPTKKLPLVVLGYSFGADTFPFAWAHLPDGLKDRIRMVGLLGTENTTPFQVTVGGWLGVGGDNPVAPAVATIPRDRVLCIYGEDEPLTICENPSLPGMETIKLAGGHHFDGNYAAIADKILAAMQKRIGQAGTPASGG